MVAGNFSARYPFLPSLKGQPILHACFVGSVLQPVIANVNSVVTSLSQRKRARDFARYWEHMLRDDAAISIASTSIRSNMGI